MQTKVLIIILAVFALLSTGSIVKPTPTPTPTPTPSPTPKPPDAVIGPSESARVQCGEGSNGTRVVFEDGGFAGNIALGDQTTLTAKVLDEKGQLAGGLVEWRLWYHGRLSIDGCNAIFTAPDSIGTAYSTSADISTRVVSDTTLTPAPTLQGEGGPIFAGFVTTIKVGILSRAKPGCFDPAGVAISINSVSTYRNVQIVVDTPRFLGREYNARVATVRDGPGTYNIQIFVDGALYGDATSQVEKCQLPTVKF
ncbi:MAG: hypothetical protein HYV39_02655 [Candidatus Levybacteria bacterium]|nr:hypothetical protein [Candidatus Levybacteria bacterium]